MVTKMGLTEKDWGVLVEQLLSQVEFLEQGEIEEFAHGEKLERIIRKMEPHLSAKSKRLIKKFLD